MDAITSGITSVVGLAETMLTTITSNNILVVILSAGFVGLALRVLRRIIKTSKAVG